MSDDTYRAWWDQLTIGRRYRIRYRPEHWSSGGGSLNPAANLIGGAYQLARGLATGYTDMITGELEAKSLMALQIRQRLGIFGIRAKSNTTVWLESIASIDPY